MEHAETKARMEKALAALRAEFAKLRTGRASPALVEGIRVEYYGSELPMNQVATLSVPESRTLTISPWDKTAIPAIERAIQKSDLGLNPINDGKLVRINLPVPTEERRKELVKTAKKMAEDARVAVRNARREGNEAVKKLQKDGKLSEDDLKKSEAEIQKITDQYTAQVDQILSHKEKEIMEV